MADFKPKDQFQQFVVDKLEYHTEKIDKIQENQEECPVWEVEKRVTKMETDKRWYNKIVAIVGGLIGGVFMVTIEWILNRRD